MKSGDGVRKRGGKWAVRWTDVHGKRHEATIEAKSRVEAREKRARLIAKVRDQKLGIYDGDADATLADVWALAEPIWKTRHNWRNIETHWRKHLLPAFGGKKVRQLSRNEVRRFLAEKGRVLEPRTCEHLRVRLGALFNFAAEEGVYRGENVASAIGPLEVPEKQPRYLEAKWVQPVIDAVPELLRNLFALAVYTGMRAGELRALKKSSVDVDHRYLLVYKSGTRSTTKTGRGRPVPLPRACLPYLDAALKASRGHEWLFVDEAGEQLSRHLRLPDVLRTALEKVGLVEEWVGWCHRSKCKTREKLAAPGPWTCPKCKRAGKVRPVHPLVFHDLRKTFGTHFYEATGDLRAAARIAGHGLDVADRLYVSASMRHLGTLADKLDFGAMPPTQAPSLPHATVETGGNDVEACGVELTPTEGKEG